jgi:small neutral amino acid transporter SnatA (MarC family)
MMYAKIPEERITEEEISQSRGREDIWVPIALPLLAGPGTISTVVVLMGGAQTSLYGFRLSIRTLKCNQFLNYVYI